MKGKLFEVKGSMSSKEILMIKFLKESFMMKKKFTEMTEPGMRIV